MESSTGSEHHKKKKNYRLALTLLSIMAFSLVNECAGFFPTTNSACLMPRVNLFLLLLLLPPTIAKLYELTTLTQVQ